MNTSPEFGFGEALREPLAARYAAVRRASLALAAPLSAEDCQVQSMPDASPTKWHLAHITWFFETFLLERFEAAFVPFDPAFRILFNSYYQGVGEQHPRAQRGLVTRPTLDDVKRYRANVDERMQALLAAHVGNAEIEALVVLGLQHEQQHQELLSPTSSTRCRSIRSRLPMRSAGRSSGSVRRRFAGSDTTAASSSSAIAGDDGAFCFDNETPRHRAFTAPFELASRPATYGDFLAFIDDDGYARPELWLSMGWDWVRSGQRVAPLYWRKQGDRWFSHTLQGLVEIDPHTPVCHLSFFEAEAFARWSGARLPTELEWELAARALRAPIAGNFAGRGAFHPLPQQSPVGDEPVQMFGDVWEWTQSAYLPYPGYRPLPGAVGEYNGKFMCNQFVLRGGSCATPEGHVRASYRNFFPPEAQWQFSGVRLARDA